jgi:hypothetical protein
MPTTTVAGQNYTFTPSQKGPYYLVMSFANGDQYGSIPSGMTTPSSNFSLQVTLSEVFGGTNLLGTTLTHIQTFAIPAAYTMAAATPAASNSSPLNLQKVNTDSSSTSAEVVFSAATNAFTYTPSDSVSKAMINLTINVSSTASFNMRYLIFNSAGTLKPTVGTGPTIPASGLGLAYGLTMKTSFILNPGDYFILQAWGSVVSFTTGSTVVVEKLPVAQGGGNRYISVTPIPKAHTRKSSLHVRRASTKKGGRR